jgi:nucleoside-diphosphate-sugar epimerase
VLGAGGYIGSRLAGGLEARGAEVLALRRGDAWSGRDLGHVIYSIAVTNDARAQPGRALQANVGLLAALLEEGRFASLLYLSTTQLYAGAARAVEDAPVSLEPCNPGDIYRATKALGEMICLASPREAVRVARLSAVYDARLSPRSFLAGVVDDAVGAGRVELQTSLDSERDFVHIDDVTRALFAIAIGGRRRVYNVASGQNVTNAAVAAALRGATGCAVSVAPGAPRVSLPVVDVSRVRGEFGYAPSAGVVDRLGEIVAERRRAGGGAP